MIETRDWDYLILYFAPFGEHRHTCNENLEHFCYYYYYYLLDISSFRSTRLSFLSRMFWCYDLCWVIVRCAKKWLVACNLRQVWGKVFYYSEDSQCYVPHSISCLPLRLQNTTLRQGKRAKKRPRWPYLRLTSIYTDEPMHVTPQTLDVSLTFSILLMNVNHSGHAKTPFFSF